MQDMNTQRYDDEANSVTTASSPGAVGGGTEAGCLSGKQRKAVCRMRPWSQTAKQGGEKGISDF